MGTLRSAPFVLGRHVLSAVITVVRGRKNLNNLPEASRAPGIPGLVSPAPRRLRTRGGHLITCCGRRETEMSGILEAGASLNYTGGCDGCRGVCFP